MSIPVESASSERILRYTRYHLAALKADPQAASLVAAIAVENQGLNDKWRARIAAEDAVADAAARMNKADLDLDAACRLCELDVLATVGKNRDAPLYRSAFPSGLSELIGMKGDAQSRQVLALVAALRESAPEVATRHAATLEAAAATMTSTEADYIKAQDAAALAGNAERIARATLIQQLRRNRGALQAIYPSDRRRLETFFPPQRREAAEEAEPVTAAASVVAPTPGV